MKKILNNSFVVIFILVLLIFPTFACKEDEVTRVAKFNEYDVATLTIYSYDGVSESRWGIMNLGHSFLSILNTSSSEISVGGKLVQPNEEISFGAWSLSAHFGIWYNVESYYINNYNKYNGRVSVEKGITIEDIGRINEFIIRHDKWTPINNCSKFAMMLWNRIAKESEKLDVKLIETPTHLIKQLKTFENFQVNKPLNNYIDCGYFNDLSQTTFIFEGGEVYV